MKKFKFIFVILFLTSVGPGSFSAKYKTLFAKERKMGANFSKYFRLVQISCGSGCSQIAILDMKSNKAFDPHITITDTEKKAAAGERVEFNEKSKNLTMRGCLNEKPDECGIHKYFWDGEKLQKTESEI